MMLRQICISVVLGLFSLSSLLATDTSKTTAPSSNALFDWLTPVALQELKVYLPSYIPTIQAQVAYQSAVPLHQEITVQWSPNTSSSQSAGAGFLLVKRWQHLQKSASVNNPALKDAPILMIATTPGGEIRALALCPDTRATTRQFDLQLPEDGQISKLVLVSVTEGLGFEPLGEVEIGIPDGSIPDTAKNATQSAVAY